MATIVRARKDESTDSVIRRYKRRALVDNTALKYRDHEFYKKPALLRKEKRKEIERRKFNESAKRRPRKKLVAKPSRF